MTGEYPQALDGILAAKQLAQQIAAQAHVNAIENLDRRGGWDSRAKYDEQLLGHHRTAEEQRFIP
jgi:hypothetical protein